MYMAASSIKVPAGVKAILHSRDRTVTLHGPYESKYIYETGMPNDMIRKVEVENYSETPTESFLSLYDKTEFKGRPVTLSTKDGNVDCLLMQRMKYVDILESFKVGPGAEVIMYQDCFEGRRRTFTGPF